MLSRHTSSKALAAETPSKAHTTYMHIHSPDGRPPASPAAALPHYPNGPCPHSRTPLPRAHVFAFTSRSYTSLTCRRLTCGRPCSLSVRCQLSNSGSEKPVLETCRWAEDEEGGEGAWWAHRRGCMEGRKCQLSSHIPARCPVGTPASYLHCPASMIPATLCTPPNNQPTRASGMPLWLVPRSTSIPR